MNKQIEGDVSSLAKLKKWIKKIEKMGAKDDTKITFVVTDLATNMGGIRRLVHTGRFQKEESMSKLLPIGYSLDLKYKCPKCDNEFWLSQAEAKTKGFKFVCGACEECSNIEPLRVSKVLYDKLDELKQSPKHDLQNALGDKQLAALRGTYTDSEIKGACVKIQKFKSFTQEDIKKIIQLIEDTNYEEQFNL